MGYYTKVKPKNDTGKKQCMCCGRELTYGSFYNTRKHIYSTADGKMDICKTCFILEVVDNTTNMIDLDKFRLLLMRYDFPWYLDCLKSAENQIIREHNGVLQDDVKFLGPDIVRRYMKNVITLRQYSSKKYADSERDGFILRQDDSPEKLVVDIYEGGKFQYDTPYEQTYSKVLNKSRETNNGNMTADEMLVDDMDEDILVGLSAMNEKVSSAPVQWSEQDLKRKDYAIEVIGYDPFEGYPEDNRKFLFNQLSPYLDDDDNLEDTYKLSQIIQIIKNNNQIDICDRRMALLDPLANAESVKALSEIKNRLVIGNDKIAKENEISVKNRSNKDVGKSTLTYLMRELREKDFDKAEADYYDQLRSAGTRWAVDMSMSAIKQNGLFDDTDKREIYEMQLSLIDKLNQELDETKERLRLLTIENDNLKKQIEQVKSG